MPASLLCKVAGEVGDLGGEAVVDTLGQERVFVSVLGK